MNAPRPLLTRDEVADLLRLSSRTVAEYVRRGELRGRLIGRRWRFREEDVASFLEELPGEWTVAGKGNAGG